MRSGNVKNKICGYVATISCLFLLCTNAQAESFYDYVNACKSDLGFQDSDVPKSFDCTKADKFAVVSMGPRVNDYMGYARITDDVDLVFACRWLQAGVYDPTLDFQQGKEFTEPPFRIARSVEMLIHNRKKGSTCFFKSKDQTLTLPPEPRISTPVTRSNVTPVIVVSPIVAATAAPGTPEANFWVSPTELDQKLPCVDCHISGPYISTPRIAYALARNGLLNNGHDTKAFVAPTPANLDGKYHAMVAAQNSVFKHFNDDIGARNETGTCAGSCHNIGYKAAAVPVLDVLGVPHVDGIDDAVLLPSIVKVFSPALPPFDPRFSGGFSVLDDRTFHAMPPSDDTSSYRAINNDTPADGVEIETFTASKNKFPVLQYFCGTPRVLEAHVVGSDFTFFATDPQRPNVNPAFDVLPDKLRTFNLREGLVCINADQPNGKQCNDYTVQYSCSDGSQSGLYNTDSPTSGDGDHEERTRHQNICGGLPAIGIAATTSVNGQTVSVNGPNDRLAQFTSTGLICKNSDQLNGATCSNYVVKYEDCLDASQANLVKIKNSWTSPPTFGDRYLTTTNNVNDAETRAQGNNYQWPSQDWVIETVVGSTNVRLRDTWSGKYLTESLTNNSSGLAIVVVHNSDLSMLRQQWVVADVPNSTTGEKYLINAGTSRYLTVGNYTSDPYFAPIVSQAYSNQSWASQRWYIQ
jgi:Mucin-2 protein WxxW repeating region